MDLRALVKNEGWHLDPKTNQVITPYAKDIGTIPLKHPVFIHLHIYAKHPSADTRFNHMKKAHNMLWPTRVWHYWTERRFRAHCEGYNYITLAAGASASKSFDAADIAILFWYAAPQERNVTIASVTLSSLMTRVWGYLTAHIKEMALPLPYKYYRANPPKILFEEPAQGKNKIDDDTLHGIFAVTAKVGDDDQAVATWIGKHPKDKILLILDECTDMPMSILNALPNLNSHPEKFQLIGIGNSNSTQDLHGLLSTPKNGWESVSPDLIEWKTKQQNGICLYFSPYESPAVTEPDPEKAKILSKFLIGKETLAAKEKELGTDSEQFYRWVLGFWKSKDTDATTVSEAFLQDFSPRKKVEWSGHYPLMRIAGLDPAFSTGGDKAVLRIADVGHAMDNKMKINFNYTHWMFVIKMLRIQYPPIETQLAEQVLRILIQFQIPLDRFGLDVTGQGRALGEVICLKNNEWGNPCGYGQPLKIYSMAAHSLHKRKKSAPDLHVISNHELWLTMRKYIEQGQVCGLDDKVISQLTSRLLVTSASGKEALESKDSYKKRMSAIGEGASPDEADSTAICFQVMRVRLGIEPGATVMPPVAGGYNEMANTKFSAYLEEQRAGASRRVELPASDFSGGLEGYVKFKSPF